MQIGMQPWGIEGMVFTFRIWASLRILRLVIIAMAILLFYLRSRSLPRCSSP